MKEWQMYDLKKQVEKLEKRLEYLMLDSWEQELFLVNTDVELADKIDCLVKVTRLNQDFLERQARQLGDALHVLGKLSDEAKGGEKK